MNFEADTVSGQADNFFGAEGAVAGVLTLSDGIIIRASDGVLFDADVDGQLALGGTQRDIDGTVLGVFAGANAELPGGAFEGTADGFLPLSGALFAN